MNEVQDTYLNLLKAALWGSNGEHLSVCDERLNEVIRLAALQGTGPLVYNQLLSLKDAEIPADLRMQMKQQCLHSMMLQRSMVPLLSKAWMALEDTDIHPILLKGFGIAQHYPLPHLRQWGDIDLYVGQEQFLRACEILRKTFPDSIFPDKEADGCKHYNFDFPNTAIETHRVSMTYAHPRDRRYYERLEEQCLTKDGPTCDLEGLIITTPEETFNVFFVFIHAWHHFCETGMCMKQICDIAILLHSIHVAINIEQLHVMLRKLHLMEPWQLIMYILVHYLGLPENECPFYTDKCNQRAELLFERVMTEGQSRPIEKTDIEGVSYLKRKWLTFKLRISERKLVYPYAPSYARHIFIGDILHGVERILAKK